MTPSQYAARYLPIQVPTDIGDVDVTVDRYRIGAPTAAQQQLWQALRTYFTPPNRRVKGLELKVNGLPITVTSHEGIRMPVVRPFYGKGSPEDCQLVLQLVARFGLIQRPKGDSLPALEQRLQRWCDDNLGLDCNGFVGNYLNRVVLENDWQLNPDKTQPGPSTDIQTIFRWAAGPTEAGAVDDLKKIDPSHLHILVRVDGNGHVMPGGPNSEAGHIAITEPGQFMRHSFVSDSMGGLDLKTGQQGMYDKFSLRTIEAAGPQGIAGMGVGANWTVFVKQLTQEKNRVFEIRRDRYRAPRHIKIAPVPDQ